MDTVLSDMMGHMSGIRARDIQMSLDLCMAATQFGRAVLWSAANGTQRSGSYSEIGEDQPGPGDKGSQTATAESKRAAEGADRADHARMDLMRQAMQFRLLGRGKKTFQGGSMV